ncbi:MAG: hypothetical protein CFE21_10910 [Bacteroidetes bacterium B1(2017)]|nr:MAG: hypothetical protein CFE21_10910 [Bacteroidetes bacterium B1(2017)]
MDKKSQIVYFLGAGASAQAIPVIEGLRPRLDDLAIFLKSFLKTNHNDESFQKLPENLRKNQDVLLHLYNEILWLYKASEYHQTIDTLAKKYYIQESTELNRLKRALIIYFYFEQALIIPLNRELFTKRFPGVDDSILDKRYDNLIASIAIRNGGRIELKSHIKIVTWNYDIQLELAIKNYIGDFINNVKKSYNIHPNILSYKNIENRDALFGLDHFAAYKLNGNAFLDPTLEFADGGGVTPHDFTYLESENSNLVGNFLKTYSDLFPENHLDSISAFQYFNFAWEEENSYAPKFNGHKLILNNAKNVFKNAKVLIIVGYSFPYFNSGIDRELFEDCWPEQIIIQDLEPEKIKNRLFELVPKFKLLSQKISNPIEIVFMEPDKYFPIHPST